MLKEGVVAFFVEGSLARHLPTLKLQRIFKKNCFRAEI
jgi:hypothetical protein